LAKAGLEALLLETRHVKAALSAMVVKTDGVDGPHGTIVPKRRLSPCRKEGPWCTDRSRWC
jgi:hypothetical protein